MDTHERLNLIRSAAIEPWERLNRALVEQKAVETTNAAEAKEAGLLAAEIKRLADIFELDSRDLAQRSEDWAMVSAASEGSRKGLLSSAARRTTLTATSHFEADGEGNYRFINNRVMIVHPTRGRADFLTAASKAIRSLADELDIEIGWSPEILEGPSVFGPAVVLDAGPDPTRVFEALQIHFHKRNANGEMVVYQPQNWQLELKASD